MSNWLAFLMLIIALILSIIFLPVFNLGLVPGSAYLITFMCWYSILIGIGILFVGISKFYLLREGLYLWLGLSFFGVAITDLILPLTLPGMPFPYINNNLSEMTCVLGQVTLASLMFGAAFCKSAKSAESPQRPIFYFLIVLLLVTAVLVFGFKGSRIIPQFAVQEGPTSLARILEFTAAILLTSAAYGFYRRFTEEQKPLYSLIAIALVFGIFASLYLMFSYQPIGGLKIAGHVLRSMMLLIILGGVLTEHVYMTARESKLLKRSQYLERERIIAETLQEALSPRAVPKIKNIEIGIRYASATGEATVGGDFYDFIELPNKRVGIVIGDVAGKGIHAASQTAMVRYMLRGLITETSWPSQLLEKLNKALYLQTEPEHFVTLLYGIYNPVSCELTYANAGHTAPILYNLKTKTVNTLMPTGIALGIVEQETFREKTIKLKLDDILILYTDGLSEARRDRELFGEERIKTFCRRSSYSASQEWADHLFKAGITFAEGKLKDDIIIVVIKFTNTFLVKFPDRG
jgi:serine phosphatase RsbU (regulator of sigma subunit)